METKYDTRDVEVRDVYTKEDCIYFIEEVYGQKYDTTDTPFDPWDQLLACESIAESTPIKEDN